MIILCGRRKIPMNMSSTRRYLPEELLDACLSVGGPYWVSTGGSRSVRIPSREVLPFACNIVSAYHDELVRGSIPDDDGFSEEMDTIERLAAERLENPPEDSAEEYVTSDEDMDYCDKYFYL